MSTGRASKVTPLSGFPEYLPEQRIIEQHFLDVIRDTFELHGFPSIETRAVEPVERLRGKGGDVDKEIYGIHRLAGDQGGSAESDLGLHFDLTVPFARYVVEHAGRLDFPFRRHQIQKVWRGERPQEGRYREFTQCDIDVVDVGDLAPHFEAEMPLVMAEIFAKLPIPPMVIQVNHRSIPEGFYRGLGIGVEDTAEVQETLRIVDKLDKLGPEKTARLLVEAGRTPEQARACLDLAAIRTRDTSFVERVRELGVEHPVLEEGLAALRAVIETGEAAAPGTMVADLRVARGLDYYTGTVYETQVIGHESWGSFCSGGRYDELASDGRNTYPGVGISIGLSRLLGLLLGQGLVEASRKSPSAVLVAVSDEETRPASVAVATALRSRGVPCEVAPSPAKFGKQIRFAERRGIPFVWFPGAGRDGDQVKDIRSGEQVDADPATWQCPSTDLRPQVTATR